MRAGLAGVVMCLVGTTLFASVGPPIDVETRARGAAKVVVGTIVDAESTFGTSQFGDQLILTTALVHVEETIKGRRTDSVSVTVEGGTVGDLTLRVSDMPSLGRGDRAVFFLDETATGGHVPNGRGHGVLKLDSGGHVQDSDLTLEDIRRRARAALR